MQRMSGLCKIIVLICHIPDAAVSGVQTEEKEEQKKKYVGDIEMKDFRQEPCKNKICTAEEGCQNKDKGNREQDPQNDIPGLTLFVVFFPIQIGFHIGGGLPDIADREQGGEEDLFQVVSKVPAGRVRKT